MIKATEEWEEVTNEELYAILESRGVAKKRFDNLMYKGVYTDTDTQCTVKGLIMPSEGEGAYKAVLSVLDEEHVINLDHFCHMQQPSFRKDIE